MHFIVRQTLLRTVEALADRALAVVLGVGLAWLIVLGI